MNTQQKNADKLTDKAFSRLWITAIVGILICIACLCSTTWAWFSADQSAEGSTLQSGRFDLDISITKEPSSTENETIEQRSTVIEITDLANGKMSCTLEKGKYTIVLKMTQDTTVTRGFCTITVGDKVYCTDSINANGTAPFTFTLDVAADDTTIIFSPAWGLPAQASVEHRGALLVGAVSDNKS